MLDDHSRVALRCRAVTHATTAEAWVTFCEAAQKWGLPAGLLSDNGLCFSGKLRSIEVEFEANLRDAGIKPITGRPYHPQTTGKVERFQQTLKKWLRKQPLAATISELQAQLDRFCEIYNNERPHQGIGRQIPIKRWQATPVASAALGPLEHPDYSTKIRHSHVTVAANGHVACWGHYLIGIGAKWAHHQALVIADATHANVFINSHLIRHLKLDPTRRYQPINPKPLPRNCYPCPATNLSPMSRHITPRNPRSEAHRCGVCNDDIPKYSLKRNSACSRTTQAWAEGGPRREIPWHSWMSPRRLFYSFTRSRDGQGRSTKGASTWVE